MRWRRSWAAGPLLGAAMALSLIAKGARSQTAGITVSRRSTGRVEADPGTGITALFLIRNSAVRAREVHTHLALPSGWRLITPESPIVVGAHRAELRLLRLAVPGDASPGTYGIRYEARGTPSGPVLARDSLLVVVRASHRLELQPMDAPELVLAGRSYRAVFMVRNRGNVSARVRIRVASSYALPALPDHDVFDIAPGAARSVSVTVRTDQDTPRPLRHRLDVVARVVADSSAVASAFTLVDVIPRSGAGPPRFHHLPMQMTLWATEPGDGMTGEIRASGSLTDGGADRIEMLLRGPDNGQGLFGDRDEYRATLTGNRYRLLLGDQSFRLSPLTETGRAGFGGGGQLSIGRLTGGGFMQRDRWTYQYTHETQRAGFLSARIAKRSSLGVNYLERLGNDPGRIWSARGVLAPTASTALDVEYGMGTGVAGTGAARSVLLTGMHRLASYRVHVVDADRDYPGAVRGVKYGDADLSIHPGRAFALTGRFTDRVTSSMLVPETAGDQHYRSVQGGVAFGHYLSAEYLRSWQEGGLLASLNAGREEALRLRTGLAGRIGGVFAGTELGRFEFGSDPQWHPFQQLFLQATLRPSEHSSFLVAVERHHGSTLVSPRSQDWLSARAHAAFQLWRGTRFRFAWNGRRYGTDRPSMYGVVDATWEQDLLFGHRLVTRARVVSFGGTPLRGESLLKVGYTIPIGLPVSASHRSARLVGRIYDATSGDPIANALVRVGDRAQLSDKSGRLVFSGLSPDTYYVHVDQHSLAGREVTIEQDPLPLHVGKLETTRFELGMVHGARLTGTVRISAFAAPSITGGDDGALVDSAAMPNVIVALTGDDGKVLRRLTDARGRFTFMGLRPGRWTLSMLPEALPEHYRLQGDSVSLNVAPGDTIHTALRVVPQRRTLHIVATVDLTAEGGSPRAGEGASAKPRMGIVPASGSDSGRQARPVPGTGLAWRPTIVHRYTVTRWDISLMQIARYMYNDASLWPKIWVANRFQLPDPDTIRPWQVLLIPDKAPLTRAELAARDAYLARRR